MHISSILVRAHPEQISLVRERLTVMQGVEVHGASDEGHLVVSIETEDESATTQTYETIGQTDGVLSVAMVFHQFESDPDEEA